MYIAVERLSSTKSMLEKFLFYRSASNDDDKNSKISKPEELSLWKYESVIRQLFP